MIPSNEWESSFSFDGMDMGHLKEEVIDFKVISIEEDGEDYLVNTQETFDIQDSDGEVSRKRFRTQFRITDSADVLQVWELIETNEI